MCAAPCTTASLTTKKKPRHSFQLLFLSVKLVVHATPPHKTLNLMRVQLGDRSSPGSSQGLELFIKFISVLCSYLPDASSG
jgi:hypothetical protein